MTTVILSRSVAEAKNLGPQRETLRSAQGDRHFQSNGGQVTWRDLQSKVSRGSGGSEERLERAIPGLVFNTNGPRSEVCYAISVLGSQELEHLTLATNPSVGCRWRGSVILSLGLGVPGPGSFAGGSPLTAVALTPVASHRWRQHHHSDRFISRMGRADDSARFQFVRRTQGDRRTRSFQNAVADGEVTLMEGGS